MKLTQTKPEVPKSILKELKLKKWDLARDATRFFRQEGLEVHVFERSVDTPHLRIDRRIDYWPASGRFFDIQRRLWGFGYYHLKEHLKCAGEIKVDEWKLDLNLDFFEGMEDDFGSGKNRGA